jgi:hypothetical protein
MKRWLLVLIVIGLAPAAALGAAKQKKRELPDPNSKVDKVARDVFQDNDRNHNGALSRTEFRSAEKEAQSRLQELVKQGVLGGKRQKDVDVKVASAGSDVTKSNKVTEQEFSDHVHRLAQQVNVSARQQNEAEAAQQKKIAAAKKAAAQRRANQKKKR